VEKHHLSSMSIGPWPNNAAAPTVLGRHRSKAQPGVTRK
jgi:hypothetical protein